MHLGSWQFELDGHTQAPCQPLVVRSLQNRVTQAWAAAAAACGGAAVAAAAPVATDRGLFSHTAASIPSPVAEHLLASPPIAPSQATAAGSSAASRPQDDGHNDESRRYITGLRRYVATRAQAAARRDVGVVPAMLIGDVFLEGSESCDAAFAAAQKVQHGTGPDAVPLPEERVAMHTSYGRAEAAGVFSHWRATGQWPGDTAPDGSSGMPPELEPVDINLSAMALGVATMVLSSVPGYAYLQRDPHQVEEAERLCTAKAAADAPVPAFSGVPVFTVPGVHLTLASLRGDVRFTPLFLSRQRLDDTISVVQGLVNRHGRIKLPAERRRRPVIVAHPLREYVTACGLQNNRPAGGDPSLPPWTQDEMLTLGPAVNLTYNMSFAAAQEVGELEQEGHAATADLMLANSFLPEMRTQPSLGKWRVEYDKAFGKAPVDDGACIDPSVPSHGIILIGEAAPPRPGSAAAKAPRLRLPDGRKVRFPPVMLCDANVFSCEL